MVSQNYKKAPEKQSLQGGIFILPQRVNQILPEGGNVACPRGSNARGFSNMKELVFQQKAVRKHIVIRLAKRHSPYTANLHKFI